MTTPNLLTALTERLTHIPGLEGVRADVPLAPHVTWRVGGPGRPSMHGDQGRGPELAAIQAARILGVPWRVLGRGSNVLVRAEGVAGLVILANRTADSSRSSRAPGHGRCRRVAEHPGPTHGSGRIGLG